MTVTADQSLAAVERLAPEQDRRQTGFWIGVLCAFTIHAVLILGANRSAPRAVGSADGSEDAIAVEIVTVADLESRETAALPPPGASRSQPAPPPQPEAAPSPEPQPPEPQAKEDAEPQQPQPKAEAKPEPAEPALPNLADVVPDAVLPKPAEKQQKSETAEKEQKPAPERKKPAPQARLDLSPPDPAREAAPPPGRSSAFTRPPGITRSGENDEFGRGVIRALRATMPPPAGILGRVTVRLFLNENGDLAEVRVVESSGRSNLDQSVVFATKQSNFPLPPLGATVADRTFLITYVYR